MAEKKAKTKENQLVGKKVAILVDNGFEESEFVKPLEALREAGADVQVVSPKEGKVKSWREGNWGKEFDVDIELSEADADDFDALVLPGGVINPDQLRMNEKAIEFVKSFFGRETQRPVAAICHGPWTLINAKVVKGRKMTSYESIKMDLINAGANWVDEEVVVDKGLVTSRSPDDLEAFCEKMVEEIREGKHRAKRTQPQQAEERV